jgi:hypothetical protein
MKVIQRFVIPFFLVLLSNSLLSTAMAIEEPKFETLRKEDPFEIRKYAPYLIAETSVQSDMDGASSKGFRRIADFIFGNNQVAGAGKALDSKERVSSKIAMTAPVVVEPLDEVKNPMLNADNWRIFFVMPSEYSETTLPRPVNPDVKIRSVPAKYYAVFNYSGFNGTSKIQDYSDQLDQWIQKNNLKAVGSPKLARYDPPWTLPIFRRNEILIEIQELQ